MSMLDRHDHERAVQAARKALQRINRAGGRRLWSDWLVIGAGFLALRIDRKAGQGDRVEVPMIGDDPGALLRWFRARQYSAR
jgi:hypothetical protein